MYGAKNLKLWGPQTLLTLLRVRVNKCVPSLFNAGSDESLDTLETMTRCTDAALICLRGRVNIPGPLLLCL